MADDDAVHSDLFLAAVEALGQAVFITDRQGIILYVNPAFTAATGDDANEAIGKPPAMLRSGRRSAADDRQMWQSIERDGTWEGTLWSRHRDGRFYRERLHIRRMAMAGGETRYVGVLSDAGEQDALQRALADAQKRELMAARTGGVVHNLNNYLAAIRGFAQLGQHMTAEPKSARYFSEVLEASDKAGALVADMLNTARPAPPDHALDLPATLRQAAHTAQSILPERVELAADIPEGEPCLVMGNRPDIEQTVLNLVSNARDALEGREGACIRLHMRTSPVPRTCPESCPYTEACPLPPGRHAILRVEDNGGGVPAGIEDRIFDPFFTTKAPGKGSGLGLASARQIVGRLGGAIWLDPVRRVGTRFQICLPCLDGDACAYEA